MTEVAIDIKKTVRSDRLRRFKALLGGFIITLITKFPAIPFILGLEFDILFKSYIIIAWTAGEVFFTYSIILYFGKIPIVYKDVLDSNEGTNLTKKDTNDVITLYKHIMDVSMNDDNNTYPTSDSTTLNNT